MQSSGLTANCGIILVSGLGINDQSYGGEITLKEKMAYAKKQAYTKTMVTINKPQYKYWLPVLEKLGYTVIETFINKRTRNEIKILTVDL